MKKIFLIILISFFIASSASAQEIIKGLTNTASLVRLSKKIPSIKNKDGSTIILQYKDDGSGMQVDMVKNGKNYSFAGGVADAKYIQVGEFDIENDGRPEILVASRSSEQNFELRIYKKNEFETLYSEWTTLSGNGTIEFSGNGKVKMFDVDGNATSFNITGDGKLRVIE